MWWPFKVWCDIAELSAGEATQEYSLIWAAALIVESLSDLSSGTAWASVNLAMPWRCHWSHDNLFAVLSWMLEVAGVYHIDQTTSPAVLYLFNPDNSLDSGQLLELMYHFIEISFPVVWRVDHGYVIFFPWNLCIKSLSHFCLCYIDHVWINISAMIFSCWCSQDLVYS